MLSVFGATLALCSIPIVCLAQPAVSTATRQTISAEELLHRVPSAAAREYRASLQALNRGDLERSIEHCRRAIQSDPENAAAYNDLGVLYLTASRWEEALAQFARAASLQPSLLSAPLNASYAALALGRFQDAETAARRAIELDRRNHRAHLLLGWSLVAQFRYTGAALESLRIAEREYPEARLAAADVLVHQGEFDAARSEVESYLKTENPEHKHLADAWLRMLTLN